MQQAIILTNGLLKHPDAKTAHGLIRGTERYQIIGVVDNADTAGSDAGELLDGKHRNIPVFHSLPSAISHLKNIEVLIIGVATVGGKLPPAMLGVIIEAIQSNISIVNGLHEFLSENPEVTALAEKHKVTLTDIRKPKPKSELNFWKGDIFKVNIPIIAVLGMDCAVGKRTTARMLKQACIANGWKAEMIYTGQTGWMQGGKYGFIFDSTLNDFVSGELENAIVSCWKETQPHFIFVEGQSSLRNPSGPCGFELIISGNAKHTVLVVPPKRKYFDDDEHWGEIPSVESEVELIEKLGSKVLAIALNTTGCTSDEMSGYKNKYEASCKLPVLLPVQEGVDKIIPELKKLIK